MHLRDWYTKINANVTVMRKMASAVVYVIITQGRHKWHSIPNFRGGLALIYEQSLLGRESVIHSNMSLPGPKLF